MLTFFSAAQHENRRVVAYHVVPATVAVEQRLHACTRQSSTLSDLLCMLDLDAAFGDISSKIREMLLSLSQQ